MAIKTIFDDIFDNILVDCDNIQIDKYVLEKNNMVILCDYFCVILVKSLCDLGVMFGSLIRVRWSFLSLWDAHLSHILASFEALKLHQNKPERDV